VVLTDFPVGFGNLKNIEAAEKARDMGIPVVIIQNMPFEKRISQMGNCKNALPV
jgi:hypothetical protein